MQNQKVAEHEAGDVMTGRGDKRVGVEIEFFGVHFETVFRELRAAGVSVSWEGYTHSVRNSWKLVYDSSVTGQGTGVGNGLELVSPPLVMADMIEQLEVILKVLNENGAKVDRSCGLHVHHEIDDFNLDHIKNIYQVYTKHQEHIDGLLPPSRRGEGFYCRHLQPSELNFIEHANSVRQIAEVIDRYRVINMKAYVKYGTVEIRQHSGTTDFEKIKNWLLITQAVVATAKAKKTIKPMTKTARKRQSEAFSKEVGIEYTKQALYSRDRKAELKRADKKRRNAIAS